MAVPIEKTAEADVESALAVDDGDAPSLELPPYTLSAAQVRQELLSIRGLLAP